MLQTAAAALTVRAGELAALTQERVYEHAVELAAVIVGVAREDIESAATAAVRRALDAAADDVREVRLSPGDVGVLERLHVQPEGVQLVADGTLSPGDAVAILDDGFIDARIETAIERARAAAAEAAT
jgi:flagellar assembly protein FliH